MSIPVIQNKLKAILKEKGYYPMEDKLNELGISKKKFTRMLSNESEPTISEAFALAEWLEVSIESLFEKIPTSKTKHKLLIDKN